MELFIVAAVLANAIAAIPTNIQPRQDTSACPYYLPSGNYEFPHLIVPINNSNIAYGHSYFADVSPNNCATIFNFDIPTSRANQQCSLYFTFPRKDQLVTSDFKWSGGNTGFDANGPGSLQLVQYGYNTGATDATTGTSQPPFGPDVPIEIKNVVPGQGFKVWSGSCGAGGVMSWKMSSADSWLTYFQDWNLCAIGLWIVYENNPPPAPASQCGTCPDGKKFASHAAWMHAYTGSVNGIAL